MNTRLEDLLPEVEAAARRALKELDERGIKCVVTSTKRDTNTQVALYSQGRRDLETVNFNRKLASMAPIGKSENYTVTNCDGIVTLSNHQLGKALDVVPAVGGQPIWPHELDGRWKDIAKVFEANGFTWGGGWDQPDMPHYEYKEVQDVT